MRLLVKFIVKHRTVLLYSYLALCILPIVVIRTEFNAPFKFAFKYFAIPIVAVCWLIGFRYKDEFMEHCKKPTSYWIGLILFPLLATLWSGGLVLGANALIPPQSEFILDGVLARKEITGGRSKSCILDVQTKDGIKRIEVSSSEYQRMEIGMPVHRTRRLGPFGFSYEWKY